jgi:DNA-binding NtrC family response regulator
LAQELLLVDLQQGIPTEQGAIMTGNPIKKILIVDDEPSILLSLSYVLKTDGVEIITSSEIEQAEEALKATYFDLVLADLRMSGVTGIEGLALLTYIKERYNTDVIIMTGYGDAETEAEAYKRGASYYFTKPVDITALLEQVAKKGIPTRYKTA